MNGPAPTEFAVHMYVMHMHTIKHEWVTLKTSLHNSQHENYIKVYHPIITSEILTSAIPEVLDFFYSNNIKYLKNKHYKLSIIAFVCLFVGVR